VTPSNSSDSGGGFSLGGGLAAAAVAAPFMASAFSTPDPQPQAPATPVSMYSPEPPAPAPVPDAPAQPRSAYDPPPPPAPAPPPPPAPEQRQMYQTGIEGESQLPTYSYEPPPPPVRSPYAQFDDTGMDYSTPEPKPTAPPSGAAASGYKGGLGNYGGNPYRGFSGANNFGRSMASTPPPEQEMEMYETGIEGESQTPTYGYRPKAPVAPPPPSVEEPNYGRDFGYMARGGLVDLLRRHMQKYQ